MAKPLKAPNVVLNITLEFCHYCNRKFRFSLNISVLRVEFLNSERGCSFFAGENQCFHFSYVWFHVVAKFKHSSIVFLFQGFVVVEAFLIQ